MKNHKDYTLPETYSSWQEYSEFLLSELPTDVADNYRKKLNTCQKVWAEKGCALTKLTCDALVISGVRFEFTGLLTKTGKLICKMNYVDDYKFTDFKSVPSYKAFAMCIINNDVHCVYMGFCAPRKK